MTERIGVTNTNSHGSIMEVIDYINSGDILVKFERGEPINTTWVNFSRGHVKYPYDKTVWGIGYIGEGKHKVWENGKNTIKYKTWQGMLRRCYSEKTQKDQSSYIGCSVFDEWLNFQNFGDWYDDNFYEIEGEKIQLDKDILDKSGKLYSPDTCIFVPQKINLLFRKPKNNQCKRDITYKIYKEKLIKDTAEYYKHKIPNKLYEILVNYIVEIK